jgi:hypothetical protein
MALEAERGGSLFLLVQADARKAARRLTPALDVAGKIMGFQLNKKRVLVSAVLGCAVFGMGYVFSPLSDAVIVPGVYLAAPFWPEGIESDFGPAGVVGFLSVVYIGAILAWSALAYISLWLLHRLRAV